MWPSCSHPAMRDWAPAIKNEEAMGQIGLPLVPSLFLPNSDYLDEIHFGN